MAHYIGIRTLRSRYHIGIVRYTTGRYLSIIILRFRQKQ